MERHDQVPEIAMEWIRDGKEVVLATVIETWGSAPRPVGSQLVISSEMEIEGSVSGGCVEGAVVAEAMDSLADGHCRVLEFGVSDDEAFSVGLACGGTIHVIVEPVGVGTGPTQETIAEICAARRKRQAIALRIDLATWCRRLQAARGDGQGDPVFSSGSRIEGSEFVLVHVPPLKLVVVGAVHIAQPLLKIARLAGYSTVLVDPRDSFATQSRFPGEIIMTDWPDEALAILGLDARTAVVTLTHDPKLDDPAIRSVLDSEAFYLGCLGSRRTHEKRMQRLADSGVPRALIDERVHAPVGLDIGAASPAEIAVAIMAEITASLRNPGHSR
ncbi:MAG: XdhC family protein [Paracoccaceae bacterium]|nr:XdhC family protein [Paracoccaceae bacterium]